MFFTEDKTIFILGLIIFLATSVVSSRRPFENSTTWRDSLYVPGDISFFSHRTAISHGSRKCVPDYHILGVRKGEATALQTYLCLHPNIAPFRINGKPQDGESPLFKKSMRSLKQYNQRFIKALNKYHFRNKHMRKRDIVIGESSVIQLPHAAENFEKMCGDDYGRFITLLRDPVERCYSQMLIRARLKTDKMNAQSNIENAIRRHYDQIKKIISEASLLEILNSHDPRAYNLHFNCFYEGLYILHLKRYFHRFPSQNIRLYFTNDMKDEQTRNYIIRDALIFIGVNPDDYDYQASFLTKDYNSRPINREIQAHQKISIAFYEEMRRFFEPFDAALQKKIGVHLPWNSSETYNYPYYIKKI